MGEMKFTPGPWEVSRTIDEGLTAVKAADDPFAICTFQPFRKNYKADAALIASAPTLYEAAAKIDGEAPEREPSDYPTVGLPPGGNADIAEYVAEIIREAFEEGKTRGRWEAAAIARAALSRATGKE